MTEIFSLHPSHLTSPDLDGAGVDGALRSHREYPRLRRRHFSQVSHRGGAPHGVLRQLRNRYSGQRERLRSQVEKGLKKSLTLTLDVYYVMQSNLCGLHEGLLLRVVDVLPNLLRFLRLHPRRRRRAAFRRRTAVADGAPEVLRTGLGPLVAHL